jgi:hypothetical protein
MEHGHREKFLNENLAPLRRYLRSQVGRPWDNVYSEIRKRVHPGNAVQMHIWQHLGDFVVTDPHSICGDIGRRGLWVSTRGRQFYVDPRNGLLREARPALADRSTRHVPSTVDRIEADDDRYYRRLDGHWFEITVREAPALGPAVWDVVLQRRVEVTDRRGFHRYRGRLVYAATKRQLGGREIRRVLRRTR